MYKMQTQMDSKNRRAKGMSKLQKQKLERERIMEYELNLNKIKFRVVDYLINNGRSTEKEIRTGKYGEKQLSKGYLCEQLQEMGRMGLIKRTRTSQYMYEINPDIITELGIIITTTKTMNMKILRKETQENYKQIIQEEKWSKENEWNKSI